MLGRITPLVSGEVYHIFNRGIDRRTTFVSKRGYQRAKETINFYRFLKPPVSLSKYLRLETGRQNDVIDILKQSDELNEIFCYCLMPNHFHFLLRQLKDKGISRFLGNFQNSYTRYFNVRHQRDGALFLDQFKAVRIETEQQLVHISRYIHLNPFTGYVVKTLEALEKYPWSSLLDYLQGTDHLVDIKFVLSFFKNKQGYKKFVFDQTDYQRKLKEIEHLLFE